MSLKSVEAATTVVARSEQVSTSAADSSTYTSETMNKLPVARTLLSAVALAPGVNQNGPNGAITISGASSFENVIMVNGANVQDNIRETPNNLFIEDAIQETTTTSSGVSAEFGRFTGGVVNTITKSGGNNFSGSFRATLNNDTWRELTPYPADTYSHAGTLPTYEATLGGPFWKDHIWFFGAFRSASTSFTGTTAAPTLHLLRPRPEREAVRGKADDLPGPEPDDHGLVPQDLEHPDGVLLHAAADPRHGERL